MENSSALENKYYRIVEELGEQELTSTVSLRMGRRIMRKMLYVLFGR